MEVEPVCEVHSERIPTCANGKEAGRLAERGILSHEKPSSAAVQYRCTVCALFALFTQWSLPVNLRGLPSTVGTEEVVND